MWLFQSLWWSVFFELRVDSYVQTKLRVIHFEKQILWHPHFDTNIRFKKSRGFETTTEIQLRGKGRGDLSLFQAPVQFVKRSSTLTHVWQTLRSRKKKKLIPKPPSLFLSTATIALFSSSLRFIHWTSVTAQHQPLIWNISNEKRKTNKKQQQQRKKGKTKIFPFSLNECGIRKSGDRFLVGTRNFFSLFHARDKTDNEKIFSIPNYNSLAQLPEDPCDCKIMFDAQRSYWGQTSFHFRHLWLRSSILLITQLYCTEKFLHCQFITRTSFIGRRKFQSNLLKFQFQDLYENMLLHKLLCN